MNDPAGTQLAELRGKLDQVDDEIVRLIARRLDTVGLILQAKTDRTQGIRDPERERQVLARVESIAQSLGVSGPLARKIFSELIAHSVARQAATLQGQAAGTGTDARPRELRVAHPGAALSHGHLAAEKYLAGQDAAGALVPCKSITDAVDKLAAASVDVALLPIETTTAGSINEVYDLLRQRDLHIVGEEILDVEHCLVAASNVPLTSVRRVFAQPLAHEQCSAFVATLPQATPVPCLDVADALASLAAGTEPANAAADAAITSPEAAAAHGLAVLRRGIGNQEQILTRYLALARAPIPFDPRIPCKTSLILSTRHEQGALLRCLEVLAAYGLSLTKLESRPHPDRPWEYSFFIDVEGNLRDPKATGALDEIRSHAVFLKLLGCYPAKATARPAHAPGIGVPLGPAATSSPAGPSAAASAEPAAPPAAKSKPAPRSKNYRLADRAARAEDTLVRVGDLLIGGGGFTVMAGPCSVESADQIQRTARFVRERGAHVLRGGVFKPRTSPYAFQGLGYEGLDLLADAGRAAGMPIITEVMAPEQVRAVAAKADILQIGARNMQNFPLLTEVGKVDRPVLIKRGLSSTIEEWLAAAEYVLAQGNGQVIMCERGIRTFESATRNTLDLSAVVVLRERTHLPVIVDPSHGTGRRSYVMPMALAARACGAHGLLIEVHPDPDKALSDGDQSLAFPEFATLMDALGSLKL